MEPKPCVQLFRNSRRLTSIGLQEASITLIENDTAFSVLLADSVRPGEKHSDIVLENVTLFRARGKKWARTKFAEVCIHHNEEGIWLAEDVQSGRLFHEPSQVPYHMIFISRRDYASLIQSLKGERPRTVFEYTQKKFGGLPGFSHETDVLVTPMGYAEAGNSVKDAQYVTSK